MEQWIFLRGLVRESRHWGAFVQQFELAVPGARVNTVDLAGCGMRCGERSATSVRDMVEDCRMQLRGRGLTGPYPILAVSMGAMVAAEWARVYPQEVAALVLINTSMRPFSAFYRRLRPSNYGRILRLFVSGASAVQWEQQILDMTTNHATSDVLPCWTRLREQSPVSPVNALRQLWAAMRYRAGSVRPHAATLLLASEQDRLVSVKCSESLARAWSLPLQLHPTAGHDLTLDDGLWVASRVQAWRTCEM
jgi:pimeloyl-ACP methyl ester carboxylesterase